MSGSASPAQRHLRLFSGPLSMFGAKAQIAALEKGLEFELVMVPFDMKGGYTPRPEEVLRINPKRQVPVLIDGDLEIFDSTQIFEYFEDLKPLPALWPVEPRARARARLLELKSDEVYFPHIIKLMGLQTARQDPAAIVAREGAAAFHRDTERLLADREYLAGDFSFADIAFFMAQLFGARMGADLTSETPLLLRWRERLLARLTVRTVVEPMVTFIVSQGLRVPSYLSGLSPTGLSATSTKHV